MATNPNATAALITTGLALLVLSLAHHWGYANFSQDQAIGLAGGAIAGVLFLGKEVWSLGIRGIALAIWNGTQKVVGGGKGK